MTSNRCSCAQSRIVSSHHVIQSPEVRQARRFNVKAQADVWWNNTPRGSVVRRVFPNTSPHVRLIHEDCITHHELMKAGGTPSVRLSDWTKTPT